MRLIILGSGGYGRVVADVASQMNRYESIAFLDDSSTDVDVIGRCADYLDYVNDETEIYPAFGRDELRMQWIEKLVTAGSCIPTIIHPTAYVSPTAVVGTGTVILPKAVVNSHSAVRAGCIINAGALIDHNCVIGEGAHICLGAIIKADNKIPDYVKIEAGTVVHNGTYS